MSASRGVRAGPGRPVEERVSRLSRRHRGPAGSGEDSGEPGEICPL